MSIVDSHCHLLILEEQKGFDIDKIVKDATESGVSTIQNICVSLDEFERVYSYAKKYSNVSASIGIHPLYCNDSTLDFIKFEEYLANYELYPKINSIGECGLDYSRLSGDDEIDIKEIRLQQSVFIRQMNWADKYRLPVVVHTRDAEEDTYGLLSTAIKRADNELRGVMHCFTGTQELACAMVDLGFYISFSGIITFKKKVEHLQDLVRILPIERILVETDAPYLSPEPYRGKDNIPSRTRFIVQKIAELKNMTVEDVANYTTKNYFELFRRIEKEVDEQATDIYL